jgi:hypothetical protein
VFPPFLIFKFHGPVLWFIFFVIYLSATDNRHGVVLHNRALAGTLCVGVFVVMFLDSSASVGSLSDPMADRALGAWFCCFDIIKFVTFCFNARAVRMCGKSLRCTKRSLFVVTKHFFHW